MPLEEEIEKIRELDKKSSATRSEAYEKLKALQERIREGKEFTGDKIKDFVIGGIGSISEKTAKPYRELDVRLKGKIGDQILVVRKEEEENLIMRLSLFGDGLMPRMDSFREVRTTLELGVLSAKSLNFDIIKGCMLLPTDNYVKRSYRKDGWKLIEGPINIWWVKFMQKDEKVHDPFSLEESDSCKLSIRIGDEVERYFKRPLRELDTTYVDALNLLGAKSPEEFKKQYDKSLYDEKVSVVNRLWGLTESETKLGKKIVSISDAAKIDYSPLDKSDIFFCSGKEREELIEIKGQIKRNLERAVKLGMHKEKMELRGNMPGVTIDVPEYISKMCTVYMVKM